MGWKESVLAFFELPAKEAQVDQDQEIKYLSTEFEGVLIHPISFRTSSWS